VGYIYFLVIFLNFTTKLDNVVIDCRAYCFSVIAQICGSVVKTHGCRVQTMKNTNLIIWLPCSYCVIPITSGDFQGTGQE